MFPRIKKIILFFLASIFIMGYSPEIVKADRAEDVQSAVTQSEPKQIGINDSTDSQWLAEYELVTENSTAVLYADMTNGHIALKNKGTGRIWYSVPNDFLNDSITFGEKRTDIYSELVVSYLPNEEENNQSAVKTVNSHNDCLINGSITVEKDDKGLNVVYDFKTIDITIPVYYTLTDSGLEASLHLDELKNSKTAALVSIALLPSFGAGSVTDDGYMLVPDGSGALIDFNNQSESREAYTGVVYGDELCVENNENSTEKQTVNMPVFGIRNNGEALFAIITEGDGMASISAESSNSEIGYNRIWSQADVANVSKTVLYENNWENRAVITKVSNLPLGIKNYKVRYFMLSQDNADYSGMATCYRNYLINEKGMQRSPSSSALTVSIYGAADNKTYFIGIPYTQILPLTTFDEAIDFIDSLRKSGVEELEVQYIGWNNSGLLNMKLPNSVKAIRKLGGKSGLEELKKYCSDNKINLYFDIDFTRYRSGGNGYSKRTDAAKTVFGSPAQIYKFMRSVYIKDENIIPYRLIAPKNVEKISNKLLDEFIEYDIENISLSTLGKYLYSDFSEKGGIYRSEVAEIYDKILSKYSDSAKKLAFSTSNAYTFSYADRIFDAPASSSSYKIFDKDIPFYQLVLRGYVNLSSPALSSVPNKRELFLWAAETGSSLYFDGMKTDSVILSTSAYDNLYSTSFDLWKDTAVEYYKELAPLLEKIGDSIIVCHEISGEITKTVYENGVTVYVNHGRESAVFDGVSIDGENFAVVD